ncbi:Lipopolysaccharide export system protein LptA [Roseobacter fucihabitans]|uniref:Lipopolysaccharide export system protein LptA n=1 Tax=Roseobacter fucihabitans TaxID=1537242 RepID=A0ABZ2C1Q3_9RHOB|nr:LptA/OstA family protein [Roseobacter litoralis]MBC6963802.1 Lipopolysaccharide export system protein LptA precursor [Roseobacter litoralis]MBC6964113.1 Lipopolysaccharide export system protein LptA precursor [Roseobacter litoralis]
MLPFFWLSFATASLAQGTQVAFGTLQQDTTLPVEVTAENLSVDQATGTAIFTGNVVAAQGEMRLSSKRLLVVYREDTQGIERMEATGDVVLVSGPDAAESERADYNIDDGTIVMRGNVLLTQGPSALTADKMTVQLDSGTAQMAGSVKTILQTGEN